MLGPAFNLVPSLKTIVFLVVFSAIALSKYSCFDETNKAS